MQLQIDAKPARLETMQERSNFMKTLSTWNFRSVAGKIMIGLALAATIGSIGVAPAFADDRRHDNRRYEHRGYDRGYERDRHYYHPYGYREPVYAPIYAPPPAPGFSIFFPFRR